MLIIMSTYTESKIITLTSQSAINKLNGTFLSNVKYELGLFLKDEPDIIHRQVSLLSAQIPYSFYVVNYTNNTIVFKANEDAFFTTATIPVGNYNANSLITALVALFDDPLSITVSITISPINGTITITRPTGEFTISGDSTCLGILGFEANTTYVSSSGVLTSPYPLNLLGIKILQVRSSIFNMGNYSSVNRGITTLLATIPVSAVPFGMIDYVDKGAGGISFSNSTLDEIDIEILDGETGQFINFNNQDWTMTILITLTRQMNIGFPSNLLRGTIAGNQGSPPPPPQGTNGSPAPPPTQTKDEQELAFLSN